QGQKPLKRRMTNSGKENIETHKNNLQEALTDLTNAPMNWEEAVETTYGKEEALPQKVITKDSALLTSDGSKNSTGDWTESSRTNLDASMIDSESGDSKDEKTMHMNDITPNETVYIHDSTCNEINIVKEKQNKIEEITTKKKTELALIENIEVIAKIAKESSPQERDQIMQEVIT
ncbi:3170_t:CDS:2, partial [Dentiscutata heterogama]